MMPQCQQRELSREPWLQEFLESRGFQTTASNTYSNGRATLRFEGRRLVALPAGSDKAWRTDFGPVAPETVRSVLGQLLAAPGFRSQEEIDRQTAQRQAAECALRKIAERIENSPDAPPGRVLRRLLWSLFNGHHVVNLWELRGVLDGEQSAWVSAVLTGWTVGDLAEDSLRQALRSSGELDRWDSVSMERAGLENLAESLSAISRAMRQSAPGPSTSRLAQAHELIQAILESESGSGFAAVHRGRD